MGKITHPTRSGVNCTSLAAAVEKSCPGLFGKLGIGTDVDGLKAGVNGLRNSIGGGVIKFTVEKGFAPDCAFVLPLCFLGGGKKKLSFIFDRTRMQ